MITIERQFALLDLIADVAAKYFGGLQPSFMPATETVQELGAEVAMISTVTKTRLEKAVGAD